MLVRYVIEVEVLIVVVIVLGGEEGREVLTNDIYYCPLFRKFSTDNRK